MPFPHFLCIGAQKAGTTWLESRIRQHPGVWLPPIKELNFFNHMFIEGDRRLAEVYLREAVGRAVVGHVRHQPVEAINRQTLKYYASIDGKDRFTEAWYSRIFDRPRAKGRLLGEVSPGYSRLPAEGMDYLKTLLGDVRLIFVVRDPVERSLSQLRMYASRADWPPSSEAEWLNWAAASDIASHSDYARSIPLWQSRFPPDRLLFIPYGDLVADPLAFIRRIEGFLGLPEFSGYGGLEERVFKSQPLPIPESAVRLVTERMRDQVRFIEATFGADFAARTRGDGD